MDPRSVLGSPKMDSSKSIKPTKKLGTGEIFSLPHRLQSTALALVSLEEGRIQDIAEESGENLEITKKNLVILQKTGFIGVKQKDKLILYFCSL